MEQTGDSNSTLINIFYKLSDKIMQMVRSVDSVRGKVLELLATIIYIVGHLVMGIVHEPWYDEAIAWQIARCATLKDVLFEIPHYEGHPPLWHLILMPFAKLGLPYEVSLSVVSLIFSGLAVGLIIWKAPFPRIIRILLPFTYFLFYQYSVIARPYCVMMLAFVLIAITSKTRDEKPLPYVLCLAFLCYTSAYGIVIAGGMAVVWLWEIWKYRKISDFVKSISYDKRLRGLLFLLFVAISLIVVIMPRKDTFATNLIMEKEATNNIFVCFLYMFLALPAEVTLTTLYCHDSLLKFVKLDCYLLVSVLAVGIILWGLMFLYGKDQKIKLANLVVAHAFFSVFASFVYITMHHIGIGLFLLLLFFWEVFESKKDKRSDNAFEGNFITNNKAINAFGTIVCSLCIIVPLFWNISSCVQDVFTVYAAGRNEAKFISEHDLDDYNIMVDWEVFIDDEGEIIGSNINQCGYANNLAPYFEHNIFFNFNQGDDSENYNNHKCLSEIEQQKEILEWKKTIPDVLLMRPNLGEVYENEIINYSDFTLVYSEIQYKPWKGTIESYRAEMYVRTDLLDEVGLKEVEHAKF